MPTRIRKMPFKFSKVSKERLETTSPIIQKIMNEALSTSMLDFGIPHYGGKRTTLEQQKLFAKKASKCDGVKRKSYHQSGNAVDIFCYVNGAVTYDQRYYFMLAHHILITARRLGHSNLRWGGDWDKDWDFDDQKFNDLCHFELR